MGNATWICFDCRESVRRPTYYGSDVPCPKCGNTMDYLGYKIPVPRKQDGAAWRLLRQQLEREHQEQRVLSAERDVRHRHELEQQLRRLESRPESSARAKAIRQLRRKLDTP